MRGPRPFVVLVLIVVALAGGTIVARKRGYKIGGWTVVRCRDGHLFSTLWVPGGSLKAIRLGPYRFQRCPVGHHWTFVTPVRDDDLTDDERRLAEGHRDTPVP